MGSWCTAEAREAKARTATDILGNEDSIVGDEKDDKDQGTVSTPHRK